jgi:hypothetical protein
MKLADFIKTADLTRMSQRSKDTARLVLVDGMRVIDAARQMEIKRQQVEDVVARIEAKYKAAQGIPKDWECVTVCMPPDQAKIVRELEHAAMKKAGLIVN